MTAMSLTDAYACSMKPSQHSCRRLTEAAAAFEHYAASPKYAAHRAAFLRNARALYAEARRREMLGLEATP